MKIINGCRRSGKTCNNCYHCHKGKYYRWYGFKAYFRDLKICLKCKLIKSQWKNRGGFWY